MVNTDYSTTVVSPCVLVYVREWLVRSCDATAGAELKNKTMLKIGIFRLMERTSVTAASSV